MKKAAIYVRVSTTGQEEGGSSLSTQEQRCREYADQRGYEVDEAHVYREVFNGDTLFERPGLAELRAAVRRREVDVVIAYALDRLSRKQSHLGLIFSEVDHAGVGIELVTEHLDDTPEGRLLQSVRGYVAEVERLKILERTQRGRRARAEAGLILPGNRPLYGYRWKPDLESPGRNKRIPKPGYDVDPSTAPVVQHIFAMAARGETMRQIAIRLTKEGIPTGTGQSVWRHTTVRYVLTSPAYTGEAAANRNVLVKGKTPDGRTTRCMRLRPVGEHMPLPPGTIPPLVDADTYAAVQERLKLNKKQSRGNNFDPCAALLRGGFAKCGYCGRNMAYRNLRKQYYCSTTSDSPLLCREHPTITVSILDAAVWQRVEAILTQPEIVAREVARLEAHDPTEADLALVDRALTAVSRQQGNLVGQLAELRARGNRQGGSC